MTLRKLLWRIVASLLVAALVVYVSYSWYFGAHPLLALPYFGESLLAFVSASLTFLGLPAFWKRIWTSATQWLVEIVDKTVRRAVWDFWAQRSKSMQESKRKKKQEARQKSREQATKFASRPILVDTSALIDGRFLDVVRAGFVDNPLIVITPVLEELQKVADSEDKQRRQRGRRGLAIMEELKNLGQPPLEVKTFKKVKDVDKELVSVAKKLRGKIATVDYNLNKVATVSGVPTLNVNSLANALKTIVLPGESLTIEVIQEGRADNQGVGFLDDGTMVVIEDGRGLVGQKVEISVSRVLQTDAGRMVFGKTLL